MFLKVKISGNDVILTPAQLETLSDIMRTAVCIKNEWVGSNKGDDGTHYKQLLLPAAGPDNWMAVEVVPDDYIAALELKTKLHKDAASA